MLRSLEWNPVLSTEPRTLLFCSPGIQGTLGECWPEATRFLKDRLAYVYTTLLCALSVCLLNCEMCRGYIQSALFYSLLQTKTPVQLQGTVLSAHCYDD